MHKHSHRDIYKVRPNDPAEGGSAPEPAPAGNRALSSTVRNSVVGILLMLALLGLSSWLIIRQEQASTKPEYAEDQQLPPAPVPAFGTRPTLPDIAIPESTAELLENLPGGATDARPRLAPDQIGRVVDLARTAQEHVRLREWERAEKALRQALEISPDNTLSLRLLGMVFIQQGRFDQAIAILKRTLETDPFRAETHANLGAAYMHKAQFDLAEDALHTALRIDPDFPAALLNIGLLYVATEQYAWAADHLARAVATQPSNPSARNNLGVALIRLGEAAKARPHFEAVVKEHPDVTLAYFNLAVTYALEGETSKAMEWIREGARRCTPLALTKFLSDPDFASLRNIPEFEAMLSMGADGPGVPRI